MSALEVFERISRLPFCSDSTKREVFNSINDDEITKDFCEGNQLELRKSLSTDKSEKFTDAIDVVSI